MGKLLGNTIGDGPPTGNNGPKGGTCFVYFRKPIKFGGYWTGGVELFVFLGGKASCLFNVFKKGNEFVFELVGEVFGEHFVCVGVL